MFKKLIWATDGSVESDTALEAVERIAASNGTAVVAVHVDELFVGPRVYGMDVRVDEEDMKAKISSQVDELCRDGIDARTLMLRKRSGSAAREIAMAAEREQADLIVVGTRGHTAMGAVLFGSVTQQLLREAPCPVLVVPGER